jgi:hypothetical protein
LGKIMGWKKKGGNIDRMARRKRGGSGAKE